MNIELEIGCVPEDELPQFLNCLCKMNMIHLANIDNEDGKGCFEEVVEDRRKETDSMKAMLQDSLEVFNALNSRYNKIQMMRSRYTDINKKLDTEDSMKYLENNLRDSKQDCISIIGELMIKLIGIDDGYEFNHWLKDNIDDYDDIFAEFARTPTNNLTRL
jgi:hypothetical protein